MSAIEDNSIDMIITDPPYPRQFQYVYEILFRHAQRVLKPRGNLITLCGHYQIDHVLDVGRQYLRFWWPLWMKQTRLTRLIGKGVVVRGKPGLWFVKERRLKYPEYGMPFDTLDSNLQNDKTAKEIHKWGQDYLWFAHYINELTKEGQTVLDPFFGSGSVGIACKYLNRNFIGIEIDKDSADMARIRIEEFSGRWCK